MINLICFNSLPAALPALAALVLTYLLFHSKPWKSLWKCYGNPCFSTDFPGTLGFPYGHSRVSLRALQSSYRNKKKKEYIHAASRLRFLIFLFERLAAASARRVGSVVTRDGRAVTGVRLARPVESLYPVEAKVDGRSFSFTRDGAYWPRGQNALDLVTPDFVTAGSNQEEASR